MNGVFFKLKAEFEPDESYSGKDIMTEILQTIRVSISHMFDMNCITKSFFVYAFDSIQNH